MVTMKHLVVSLTLFVGFAAACGSESVEDQYLAALDEAGAAEEFVAGRQAVANAEALCARIDAGEPAQGTEGDRIGVEFYCADYAEAFQVLEIADVEGSFVLFDEDFGSSREGSLCSGSGGYGDISASTAAVLRDRDGQELARTSLGPGSVDGDSCVFEFRLTDITEGSPGDVYVLEVGDRGQLDYSFLELTIPGAVALSLGD